MSAKHRLLYVTHSAAAGWLDVLETSFSVSVLNDVEAVGQYLDEELPQMLLCDCDSVKDSFAWLQEMHGLLGETPVVMVAEAVDLQDRLKGFELGCEDYIAPDLHPDELLARTMKIVFDRIANQQLKSQVQMANAAAFQAMSSTSDLGVNIQFFLDSASCQNFDELGMRLFQAFQSYGLICSLQIRGRYETKNMEANGMAKDMESSILSELKNAGRYYDFGGRSVMNYEQVSVLVKNMPVDNEERYGQVKDNIFSLLQAVDGRVKALDNVRTIEHEQNMIRLMVTKVTETLDQVEERYISVVRQGADIVEDMADEIQHMVNFMGLSEEQENRLEHIIAEALIKQEKIFSEGLKIDSRFETMMNALSMIISENDQLDAQKIYRLLQDQ